MYRDAHGLPAAPARPLPLASSERKAGAHRTRRSGAAVLAVLAMLAMLEAGAADGDRREELWRREYLTRSIRGYASFPWKRAISRESFEAISSLEDLVQWSGPSSFTFPLDPSQLAAYLEKSRRPNSTCRAFRVVDGRGKCFGMVEIGLMDRNNQSASLCRVLIYPHERKRGLCLPMMREALRLSFEDLGMRRIDLRVYSFNSAAVRCYERAGLVVEGVLRKGQMVGDSVWDTVLMGILREEWDAGRQPSPGSGSESQ